MHDKQSLYFTRQELGSAQLQAFRTSDRLKQVSSLICALAVIVYDAFLQHQGLYVSSRQPSLKACLITNIYKSNLAHLNLPTPEAVFEINFFRRNPLPCEYFGN